MTRNLAALFATVAATASLLAGCGGGGGTGDSLPGSPPPPPPPVARGTLVAADTNLSSKTPRQIDLFGADGSKGPVAPGETATCGASFRQINYATVDASGATVTASAGLLLPVDVTTGGECTTSRPLITFQHGTSDTNTFEGANAGGTLSQTLAMYFVSHGYVVVVPDYLGYGASIGHYHPYVVAEEEANVVIDAVRAARNWAAANAGTVSLNGQLFLSGTSEGGYITMAAHRAMERDFPSEFTITADVPVSGPYDLATEVMDDLLYADLSNNEEAGSTAFLLSGMQNVYGDLWTSPSEVFQPPWDATAYNLFPSALYASDEAALNACQIPFNITQSPSRPIGSCARNPLLQASFVADYENAVPGTPGGIARGHVEANGLLQGWANGGRNRAPMTVCYGDLDPTAMGNAVAASNYFGTAAVDVQTSGPDFITSWMAAVSANPGNLQYHGGIEAPGCTAYARYVIFDSYAAIVP
jgi:hypothetical protein